MGEESQRAKVQAEKGNRRKAEPALVESAGELAGLQQFPGGPMAAFARGSIEDQAGRLGDMRLQGTQIEPRWTWPINRGIIGTWHRNTCPAEGE